MANQGNKEVHLTKRVLVNGTLKFCAAVEGANHKIKQDIVLVRTCACTAKTCDHKWKEERHPEGTYYLEWHEGSKRRRLAVGDNAADASEAREQKRAELNAIHHGIPLATETDDAKRSLRVAITDYLDEIKLTKKHKTLLAYNIALEYFMESCSKIYLEDIERKDLLKFHAFLRDKKEQSARSCWNKFGSVVSFLKKQGVKTSGHGGLLTKNDWPQFTEEDVEIYEKEDLDKFFAECDAEERLWFEFFQMTGMREQEVMYTYWSDVNLTKHVVRVTHKPDRGWTPKAYKEREIPIPDKLVAALKEWKTKANRSCNLLFPTAGCKPKLDFLDCCKAIAERADLNPEDFWLHKFRATFATWHLWAGVDLRTVQSWMGHSDLASTMRYLKPNHGQEVRVKVNNTFA